LVFACAAISWGCGSESELPQPALDGIDPPVAERIREAKQTVSDQPSSGAAWGRLGEVYDVHGFEQEAVDCYEKARELEPAEWRWPYFLGIVLLDVDSARSRDAFGRAAELAQTYAPAEFHLALAALQEEDLDAAERHFRRALEIDPTFINANLGLARVAHARGDAAAAVRYSQEAVRQAPEEASAHLHLANAYRLLGDAQLAEVAQRVAETSPLRPQAYGFSSFPDPVRDEMTLRVGVTAEWQRRKAEWLLGQGRVAEAVESLRQAVDLDGGAAATRLEYARALAKAGRLPDAAREIEAVIEADAENADAHSELGGLLATVGRTDEAIAEFQRALEIDPEMHEVRGNLGAQLVESGRVEEGLALLREAAAALPGTPDATYNLAAALVGAGRPEQALEPLDVLEAMRPNLAPALALRGTALAMMGRLEESVTALRRGLELQPEDPELYAELGSSLWKLERYDEALAALVEASRRAPQDPDIARELAWALATCPREELRNGPQALDIARRLCEGAGSQNPTYLDALAAAQAETGDFTAAVESVGRGIDILERAAGSMNEQDGRRREALEQYAVELRARRGLYQRGAAYRES
jgi:tetratricopeptide (TPR) repeat protein